MSVRRLAAVVAGLALVTACGEAADQPAAPPLNTQSTVASTTEPPVTTSGPLDTTEASPVDTSSLPPATSQSTTSTIARDRKLPEGLYCKDVAALGLNYAEAAEYWRDEGTPGRMDADHDGVPCETVYSPAEVDEYLNRGAWPLLCAVPDDPGLPAALPRSEIPWERVNGPGWVLFDYLALRPEPDSAPAAIYLSDPSGELYQVASWATDKWPRIVDWSPVTNRALAIGSVGDVEIQQLAIIDLKACDVAAIRSYDVLWGAQFLDPSGERLLITTGTWSDDTEHYRLEVANLAGGVLAVLESGSIGGNAWEEDATAGGFSTKVVGDGAAVATASPAGISAHTPDGLSSVALDVPGYACVLTRGLEDSVLASCVEPAYAEECWDVWGAEGGRGLWEVPVDGSAARAVWIPEFVAGDELDESCLIGTYADVTPLAADPGTRLFELFGCCECGGGLVLQEGSADPEPILPDACAPGVVAARGKTWVAVGQLTEDGWRTVLFEIDRDGELLRYLTPAATGFGGVQSALASD